MRATERLKGKRPVQVIIDEEQWRRLRIRAAMEATNVSDLIRIRLADIIEPGMDLGIAAAAMVPR